MKVLSVFLLIVTPVIVGILMSPVLDVLIKKLASVVGLIKVKGKK